MNFVPSLPRCKKDGYHQNRWLVPPYKPHYPDVPFFVPRSLHCCKYDKHRHHYSQNYNNRNHAIAFLHDRVVGFPNWHVSGCQEQVSWGSWLWSRCVFFFNNSAFLQITKTRHSVDYAKDWLDQSFPLPGLVWFGLEKVITRTIVLQACVRGIFWHGDKQRLHENQSITKSAPPLPFFIIQVCCVLLPGAMTLLNSVPADLHIIYKQHSWLHNLHIISSVRSSNSHPDLLVTHPTFSDHTGPQHWTFTFWATTAI